MIDKKNVVFSKKSSKRLKKLKQGLDLQKVYIVDDALELVKVSSNAKFDETIELAIKLGVDPKHSDQMVRGVVTMPHGTGKKVRVAVFAENEKANEAKNAGADIVGADDLIERIEAGNIDFDRCIATPEMMAKISRVARKLGPLGMMPNPKLGTVTLNIKEAVQAAKSGQVEFRVEKAGIVHAGFGKASFKVSNLKENLKSLIDTIIKLKPSGAKGTYLKSAYLSSTMGPSYKVDISTILS